MTNELKLHSSPSSFTNPSDPSMSGTVPPKKKSGCGCLLMGCLIVLFLISAPFIGGGIYLATLDETDLGSFVIGFIKSPQLSTEIKNAIQDGNMAESERQALLQIYDKLVANYDSLPDDKKEIVNRDMWIVITKAFKDHDESTPPPPELMEMITILSPELSGILNTTTPTTTTPTTTTPTTSPTTNTTDPFNFDLPATNTAPPPTNTTPPSTPTPPGNNDFSF